MSENEEIARLCFENQVFITQNYENVLKALDAKDALLKEKDAEIENLKKAGLSQWQEATTYRSHLDIKDSEITTLRARLEETDAKIREQEYDSALNSALEMAVFNKEEKIKSLTTQLGVLRKVLKFIVAHCDKDYTREIERPEFNAMMENLYNQAKQALEAGGKG